MTEKKVKSILEAMEGITYLFFGVISYLEINAFLLGKKYRI